MPYVHTTGVYATADSLCEAVRSAAVDAGWELVADYLSQTFPTIAPLTAYSVNDHVVPPVSALKNGAVMVCTVAGTTGSTVTSAGSLFGTAVLGTATFRTIPKRSFVLRSRPKGFVGAPGYVWFLISDIGSSASAANRAMLGMCGFSVADAKTWGAFVQGSLGGAGGVASDPVDVFASESLLVVAPKNGASMPCAAFFPETMLYDDTVRTTVETLPGTNVTISVTDSSKFIVGNNVRWIAPDGSWRETVRVVSVPSPTTVVVDSVATTTIPIGSYIGTLPMPLVVTPNGSNTQTLYAAWEPTLSANKTVNLSGQLASACNCYVDGSGLTEKDASGAYPLSSASMRISSYGGVGKLSSNVLVNSSVAPGSVMGINVRWRGAVVSYTADMLTIGVGFPMFTAGALVGLRLAITAGPGVGQTRTIVSNTEDAITLSSPLSVAVASGSYFGICEKTYVRCGYGSVLYGLCLRELA